MLLQVNPRIDAAEEAAPPSPGTGGDTAALAAFYEAHVDQLYQWMYARVAGDRALAEEIIQETFVRAVRDIHQYDPGRGSLAAWLRTLSRNAARDVLRAHHRGTELRQRWEEQHRALGDVAARLDREPLGETMLARAEVRATVQLVLGEIAPHYRRVLQWKYRDGESLAEIADRLATNAPAAKSLLARARRAFREAFIALTREMEEVP